MLDPIADMLTRIRNATRAGYDVVKMPSSKLKIHIANVLVSEGFAEKAFVDGEIPKKTLNITLKYVKKDRMRTESAIQKIDRVSKEGQRIYVCAKDIVPIKNGYGISIISTSKGVMTGSDAHKKHLGGEVICNVW